MDFKAKAKSRTSTTTLRVQRQALVAKPVRLQKAAEASQGQLFGKSVSLQRQVTQPVLQAAGLRRAEEERLDAQRQVLSAQVSPHPFSEAALAAAIQRQRDAEPPGAVPLKPQSNADWVTVMRAQAEQISGRMVSSRESAQFSALQQQVSATLSQRYRADRQPAPQRQQQYAEHVVALQRHPLSAQVGRVFLSGIPAAERSVIQRLAEETLQRQAEQDAQDQAVLHQHDVWEQLQAVEQEATVPVAARIQARRGGGSPLPAAVLRHLEQGLNHDLSAVRIHDDGEADKLSKSVQAVAFTTGTDIFFRRGAFNPNTQSGLELLAHEVTHTVQQSKGMVAGGIDPDAALEQEARSMGAKLAQSGIPQQAARQGTRHLLGRRVLPTSNAVPAVQRKGADPQKTGTYYKIPDKYLSQIRTDPRSKERYLPGWLANKICTELKISFIPAAPSAEIMVHPGNRILVVPLQPAGSRRPTNKPADAVPTPAPQPRGVGVGLTPTPSATPTPLAPQASPATEPEQAAPWRAYVSAENGLRLLQTPEQNASSARATAPILSRGTIVRVTQSRHDGWAQVVSARGPGWVEGQYLRRLDPGARALGSAVDDPGATIYTAKKGDTLFGLIQKYYRVPGGKDAFAKHGQDMRYFANLIAQANQPSAFHDDPTAIQRLYGVVVPGGDVLGKTLVAGTDYLIPSYAFALAHTKDVPSGSLSAEMQKFAKRIEAFLKGLVTANLLAVQKYYGPAIARAVVDAPKQLLQGLIQFALLAGGILATTTAIGAVAGFFAGGVGAAPGASIGFEIGLAILDYVGIGFLVVYIGSQLGQFGLALGRGLKTIWDAEGDPKQLDLAAQQLASAMETFVSVLIQALILYLAKEGFAKLAKTKFGQQIGAASQESPTLNWLKERRTNATALKDAAKSDGVGGMNNWVKERNQPSQEPPASLATSKTQSQASEGIPNKAESSVSPARPLPEISNKVTSKDGGKTYIINRKNVSNREKIIGQPEATVKLDAAREVYAAELAATKINVDRVYLGREADAIINAGKAPGKDMSVDVVAVTKQGQYILFEGKGKNIEHGLEQILHSSKTLGFQRVIRKILVLPENIQVGYKVVSGKLYQISFSSGKYEPVIQNGISIEVIFTSERVGK